MKFPVEKVRKAILAWGKEHYRILPWRETMNPWQALLAEVLLQRTSASHVNRYFDYVTAAFPDHLSVIYAKDEELQRVLEQFGMTRRVRTIRELAEYIDLLDHYPDDFEALVQIYGIGQYTASAYLSLHRNVRAILVDSNVARWLARMTGKDKPSDVRNADWLWELCERLTPRRRFRDYNYAVLDFSMTICKIGQPKCESCPLAKFCMFGTTHNA